MNSTSVLIFLIIDLIIIFIISLKKSKYYAIDKVNHTNIRG